jgi:hypothetical protein
VNGQEVWRHGRFQHYQTGPFLGAQRADAGKTLSEDQRGGHLRAMLHEPPELLLSFQGQIRPSDLDFRHGFSLPHPQAAGGESAGYRFADLPGHV